MKMDKDTQSRKWQITINNPISKGFTHENIDSLLKGFKSLLYFCMSDEIGNECSTIHTHIYVCFSSGVRFSTLLKKFEGAHFEMARGTSSQNRDYVFKTGKWKNSDKSETTIEGTQEEYGELPVERPGRRSDLDDLYDMIRQGYDDYEIMEQMPDKMLCLDKIQKAREVLRSKQYEDVERDVEVIYSYGDTGTGKTSSVYKAHGYRDVCMITNYRGHAFDDYRGQDVLLFEEFRSSLYLDDMLKYLDRYPIMLPARYGNKVASYTKVYINSNIPLIAQYPNVQKFEPTSWAAFLRRISRVRIFRYDGVQEMTVKEYMRDFVRMTESEERTSLFKDDFKQGELDL